jgi:hypothetical protein
VSRCSNKPCAELFDHLVGAGEQSRRYGDPKRFSSDQVDDKIELGRLLDRQIGGLRAAQYLVDVVGCSTASRAEQNEFFLDAGATNLELTKVRST